MIRVAALGLGALCATYVTLWTMPGPSETASRGSLDAMMLVGAPERIAALGAAEAQHPPARSAGNSLPASAFRNYGRAVSAARLRSPATPVPPVAPRGSR